MQIFPALSPAAFPLGLLFFFSYGLGITIQMYREDRNPLALGMLLWTVELELLALVAAGYPVWDCLYQASYKYPIPLAVVVNLSVVLGALLLHRRFRRDPFFDGVRQR